MPTVAEYIETLDYPLEVRTNILRRIRDMPTFGTPTYDRMPLLGHMIGGIRHMAEQEMAAYERQRHAFIEERRRAEKERMEKEMSKKSRKHIGEIEIEKVSFSPREIRDKPLLRMMRHLSR